MIKVQNFVIVATFWGLWTGSFLSSEMQTLFGFILIMTFGIFHGANDLTLIEKIRARNSPVTYARVLFYYILIVSIGAILFYIVPIVALILFIGFSSYHFGEQQWSKLLTIPESWLRILLHFLYGIIVLLLIFNFNVVQVEDVIFDISSKQIRTKDLFYALIVSLGSFFIICLIIFYKYNSFRKIIVQELIYLLILMIIFRSTSLIWGFALYFVLWHSIPSMNDQIRFLYGKSNLASVKKYILKAFPYWIISLLGIAVIYLFFKKDQVFDALFFSFLASITFPHVIVIITMSGTKISDNDFT